jgi:hypothetical protein
MKYEQHVSIRLHLAGTGYKKYIQESNQLSFTPLHSSPITTALNKVRLERTDQAPCLTGRRLHVVHVISPPGTRSPPRSTGPDIRVLLHVCETVLDSRNALGVVAAGKLANEAHLLVVLEPLSRGRQALAEDGAGDALLVGAAAVRVEVLVHLVDELVLRVLEGDEAGGVARRDPGPGAGPRVALGRDVLLCGARCADAVDGGLVQVEDELLVHVVELVARVEDDALVVLVLACDVLPPRLEAGCVGDNGAVEAAVVVRLHHGVRALGRDVVDRLGQVAKVGLVEGAREGGRQTLHDCVAISTLSLL